VTDNAVCRIPVFEDYESQIIRPKENRPGFNTEFAASLEYGEVNSSVPDEIAKQATLSQAFGGPSSLRFRSGWQEHWLSRRQNIAQIVCVTSVGSLSIGETFASPANHESIFISGSPGLRTSHG
jgi:hypothetical protein